VRFTGSIAAIQVEFDLITVVDGHEDGSLCVRDVINLHLMQPCRRDGDVGEINSVIVATAETADLGPTGTVLAIRGDGCPG